MVHFQTTFQQTSTIKNFLLCMFQMYSSLNCQKTKLRPTARLQTWHRQKNIIINDEFYEDDKLMAKSNWEIKCLMCGCHHLEFYGACSCCLCDTYDGLIKGAREEIFCIKLQLLWNGVMKNEMIIYEVNGIFACIL
jgi:hypothetical protein